MASVLVVDDDRLNRKLMVQVCRDVGLEVTTAEDGIDALDKLGDQHFDLMLLDLTMPRLDGLGVLEKLNEQPGADHPAVVIVTGATESEGKMQGLELGAVDFVEKPFRHQELGRRLQRVLSIAEMQRKLVKAEAKLAELRATDSVTGSGTFGELHRVLDAAFYYAQSIEHTLSCIAVSDEGYGQVLEEHGREAGEARLKDIADAIRAKLRQGDRMFRLDMAEFVILLPGTAADGARIVLEKIRAATDTLEGLRRGDLAIAAASYPHDDIRQASQLFRATTLALAQARSQPDERVGIFSGFAGSA